MSNLKLVKFEEVTPTLLRVAYFDGHLVELISHLNLPIYGAYDGLDEMVFAFLTLPSGRTVTLGEYANSPRIGVDLYVDSKMGSIPAAIYESCQQIGISKSQVVWFRDKFQAEINQLFAEWGSIQEIEKSNKNQEVIYNPIACFLHSLKIYSGIEFPDYWAMLQYNLGAAYYEAFKSNDGDRGQNLKLSIHCYHQSEKVYTQDKYPERWRISKETLKTVKTLKSENLTGASLAGTDLTGANLSEANLMGADLTGANLSEANLMGANLMGANLNGVDLYESIVVRAYFKYVFGISHKVQQDLKQRGAIFDDRPPIDSRLTLSSSS